MKLRLRSAIIAGALLVSMFVTALPASADAGGNTEGCTPGFWKNHTEVWQEYSSAQTIGSVFSGTPAPYASMTLLQGLQLGGGPGVAGAQQNLLRAAIASLLNAAYDSEDGLHLQFPWRRDVVGVNGEPPLIPTVNAALTSGSRSGILALAAQLDTANNLGCPL
jgi:hypothetical protein